MVIAKRTGDSVFGLGANDVATASRADVRGWSRNVGQACRADRAALVFAQEEVEQDQARDDNRQKTEFDPRDRLSLSIAAWEEWRSLVKGMPHPGQSVVARRRTPLLCPPETLVTAMFSLRAAGLLATMRRNVME